MPTFDSGPSSNSNYCFRESIQYVLCGVCTVTKLKALSFFSGALSLTLEFCVLKDENLWKLTVGRSSRGGETGDGEKQKSGQRLSATQG